MKRFLLFAGYDYYPHGGWNDFKGAFDTIEEAQTAFTKFIQEDSGFTWGHILDTSKVKVILQADEDELWVVPTEEEEV
jgi:hypothetical protein